MRNLETTHHEFEWNVWVLFVLGRSEPGKCSRHYIKACNQPERGLFTLWIGPYQSYRTRTGWHSHDSCGREMFSNKKKTKYFRFFTWTIPPHPPEGAGFAVGWYIGSLFPDAFPALFFSSKINVVVGVIYHDLPCNTKVGLQPRRETFSLAILLCPA